MTFRNHPIPLVEPYLGKNASAYVEECLTTKWISSKGRFIPEFENAFANFVGVKYAVAVSNGTVALHLALLALNFKPEDEVIVPDLTFAATLNTVLHANLKPVIVDIDPITWNISPEKIIAAITSKTKAIIPVHLYGYPCNMTDISKIARDYNLKVIEDAAEAHGAQINDKKVGSFGEINCFSFFGNKIVTTGEGGMCVTNDENLYEKMLVLRDHGMNRKNKYHYDAVGYNYRITNPQAAIGLAQVEEIDAILNRRNQIADLYERNLSQVEGIRIRPVLQSTKPVNWLFTCLVKSRDSLMKFLEENLVETRPMFFPLHEMNLYKKYSSAECATSKEIAYNGINLPTYYNMPLASVESVCDLIKKWSEQ